MKIMIGNTKNFYTTYYQDSNITIIIAPGGAYQYTSVRESECVAKAFNQLGYNAVVVNYREQLDLYPAPYEMIDAVISEVKENRKSDTIITLGFSAGGHAVLSEAIYGRFKPDMMVLCYPVVSTDSDIIHPLSFQTLLGEGYNNKELMNEVSLEKHITDTIPKTFLWHTLKDDSVSVLNSTRLFEAYKKINASIEMHIFPYGGHGLSLANAFTAMGDPKKESSYIGRWINMVDLWIKENTKI